MFTAFEPEDICLVFLRNVRQPPVPTKEALEELVEVIAPNVLLGTWGLTLAWGMERFPLDNVHTDLEDRLLLETESFSGLLPHPLHGCGTILTRG